MAETTGNVWLIYGSTGWIGGKIIDLLSNLVENQTDFDKSKEWSRQLPSWATHCIEEKQWPLILPIGRVIRGRSRLENRSDLEKEIDEINPTYVINCAGLTGRPNVDWCEDHKLEVIRVNMLGTLNLFDLCQSRHIHVTNFATGCIYAYDGDHTCGSGFGFNEEDEPNFHGSFYSHTKAMMDDLVRNYNNVLTLRLRMPISDDLSERSFVTKITKYEKVINIPNSMTVLYDLLPVAIHMTMRGRKGVYNFTNPGTISHNQILDLYRKYINSKFTYTNFTVEEQDKILKAQRSNNELDVSKLVKEYPKIPSALNSIQQVFIRIKAKL